MALTFIPRTAGAGFFQQRYGFIAGGEGETYRIYTDSRGIPTLGAGYALATKNLSGVFTLRSRTEIEAAITAGLVGNAQFQGAFAFTDAEWLLLNRVVNFLNNGDVASAQADIPTVPAGGNDQSLGGANKFHFYLDNNGSRQLFDYVIQSYEQRVFSQIRNARFATGKTLEEVNAVISALAGTNELIALTDLKYTGVNFPRTAVAILQGDRATAWFEIRYRSNPPGTNDRLGIANRRYRESDLFGLFNDENSVDEDEAKHVLEMYTRNRQAIRRYEEIDGLVPPPDRPRTTANLGRADLVLIGLYSLSVPIEQGQGRVLVGTEFSDGTTLIGGDQSDLMLGEGGDDRLEGLGGQDVLYGGGGKDTLIGGTGNDFLLGGTGIDEYRWNTGDGLDTIIDEDKQGRIFVNGQLVRELLKDGSTYITPDGRVTGTLNSPLTLSIDGEAAFVIQDFADTDQGILRVREISAPEPTTRTIVGDLEPIDFDPNTAGVQTEVDDLGNVITDPNVPAPNRADALNGSAGADLIQSGGGNDTVTAGAGGDQVQAGTGHDFVYGEAGNDVLEGGGDGDVLSGGEGDDRLYANAKGGNTLTDISGAIAAGSGLGTGLQGDWLAGGAGDDILIGGADNDVLTGGEGVDLLIGGAGADNLLGDSSYVATSLTWSFTDSGGVRLFSPVVGEADPLDGAADEIYGGSGEDFIRGGRGDDVIYGEGDADDIAGESGSDVLIGGAGNDVLSGDNRLSVFGADEGDDYLEGGEGDDLLVGDGGDDFVDYGRRVLVRKILTDSREGLRYGERGGKHQLCDLEAECRP